MRKAKEQEDSVQILEVSQGQFECYVLGTTPLILNRMSAKSKHSLLLPQKKTAVEKATTLKHAPLEEFRASAYTLADPTAPTYIGLLTTAFKRAMMTAALDLPGARKAQVGRLTYVIGDMIPVYGVPKLLMAVTRSADMAKTPDVRSRAIVPQWACRLVVTFVQPLMRSNAVGNLLGAAGMSVGVGDWRLEKGAGNYGLFRLVSPTEPAFERIIAEGGREAQIEAMESPACYDDETSELLSWYDEEVSRRKLKGVA